MKETDHIQPALFILEGYPPCKSSIWHLLNLNQHILKVDHHLTTNYFTTTASPLKLNACTIISKPKHWNKKKRANDLMLTTRWEIVIYNDRYIVNNALLTSNFEQDVVQQNAHRWYLGFHEGQEIAMVPSDRASILGDDATPLQILGRVWMYIHR